MFSVIWQTLREGSIFTVSGIRLGVVWTKKKHLRGKLLVLETNELVLASMWRR